MLAPFAFFLSGALESKEYFGEIVKIDLIDDFPVVEDHFERSEYFLQTLFFVCLNELFHCFSFRYCAFFPLIKAQPEIILYFIFVVVLGSHLIFSQLKKQLMIYHYLPDTTDLLIPINEISEFYLLNKL